MPLVSLLIPLIYLNLPLWTKVTDPFFIIPILFTLIHLMITDPKSSFSLEISMSIKSNLKSHHLAFVPWLTSEWVSLHPGLYIIESQNHRMVWFGRDLKDHLAPMPLPRAFLGSIYFLCDQKKIFPYWYDSHLCIYYSVHTRTHTQRHIYIKERNL